jgi:hypothetical protein
MPHKRLRRASGLVLVAGCAMLAIPLSAAPPAAASPATSHPPAFDEKTQFLTSAPSAQDPESCVSRSIGLISDTYASGW